MMLITLMQLWLLFQVLPSGEGSADPQNFAADCFVTYHGTSRHEPCQLINLPDPAYWNRWGILFATSHPEWTGRDGADWIREDATEDGTLDHTLLLWGRVNVTPTDSTLRQRFHDNWARQRDSAFEAHPTHITVMLYGNTTFILFEQSIYDFSNGKPTVTWQNDFLRQWALFGNTKYPKATF